MNLTTKTQSRSVKSIARHLTGSDLEEMTAAYRAGKGTIKAPRGHTLTRAAFEDLASYLKVALA